MLVSEPSKFCRKSILDIESEPKLNSERPPLPASVLRGMLSNSAKVASAAEGGGGT